jgi:hypothetical protein
VSSEAAAGQIRKPGTPNVALSRRDRGDLAEGRRKERRDISTRARRSTRSVTISSQQFARGSIAKLILSRWIGKPMCMPPTPR